MLSNMLNDLAEAMKALDGKKHVKCHLLWYHTKGKISVQWPARNQPKVAAACILSSVPYTFCSILRCETIRVRHGLFQLNQLGHRCLCKVEFCNYQPWDGCIRRSVGTMRMGVAPSIADIAALKRLLFEMCVPQKTRLSPPFWLSFSRACWRKE